MKKWKTIPQQVVKVQFVIQMKINWTRSVIKSTTFQEPLSWYLDLDRVSSGNCSLRGFHDLMHQALSLHDLKYLVILINCFKGRSYFLDELICCFFKWSHLRQLIHMVSSTDMSFWSSWDSCHVSTIKFSGRKSFYVHKKFQYILTKLTRNFNVKNKW